MKKVSLRAYSALLLALLVLIFLVIYIVRYVNNGEDWALYFDEVTSGFSYSITDRNGATLATMGGGGRYYCDDTDTRIACYHVLGDYAGNVGTGALQQYKKELSGFNLISGIEHREDEALPLTIDADLNKTAYNALAGRKGAVIVSNYKTGEIICMVSSPSIDPLNVPKELPDGAYINRAISATFTPGSVFKLITLTAALDTMDDINTKTFQCNGSVDVKGVRVKCTGTHGNQTIEQALANSCNCAFAELSLELGADTLAEYAQKLGITTTNKLDGIDCAKGTYVKDDYKSAALAWSGIGQSEDLVCPYSMLRVVSAFANNGTVVEPSLIGNSEKTTPLVNPETADKVKSMMSYNVVYKYGQSTFPGLDICAKTGTAEVGEDKSPHGWFVGFLNSDAHPYAFVVFVENGGSGLGAAGSVANTVLQAAVKK